jgi:pentatricopeptide repeat protein
MDEAKPLLAEMSHKDLTPDTVTYSTLMKGLCRGGRVLDAQKLMCSSGLLPDLIAYSILLDGL